MKTINVFVAHDGAEFKNERECQEYETKILSLTPKQRAAIFLHSKHCTINHTDGCGWYYEHDWEGYAHKHWLDEVDVYIEEAKKLNDILEGMFIPSDLLKLK